MSLAQRRTTPEGIDTVLEADILDNAIRQDRQSSSHITNDGDSRVSDSTQHTAMPKDDGIWQTLSYDPFAQKQLQHYESFPPEIEENRPAHEVPSAKRIGKP